MEESAPDYADWVKMLIFAERPYTIQAVYVEKARLVTYVSLSM